MFPEALKDKTLVISVEPDPDDSPAPFAIKPFAGKTLAQPAAHTVYDLPMVYQKDKLDADGNVIGKLPSVPIKGSASW